MPLLKQEVFLLAETPEDLSPDEMVFQVRFTKEIFRDYDEYVKRMNLYRQRIWTCKATGREGLTYEKALVSECRAAQRAEFPKDFMGPVLHLVQFSQLEIDELVDKIYTTLSERFVVGEEVSTIKGDAVFKGKILEVTEKDGTKELLYEVGWIDGEGGIVEKTVENAGSLVKRKPPFTKAALKKYIQESAYGESTGDIPWLVKDKLVRKFKIPQYPPEDEKKQVHTRQNPNQRQVNQAYFDESLQEVESTKKRKRCKENGSGKPRKESRKDEEFSPEEYSEELIDDNLVEQNPDDPPLPERPTPCTDFPVDPDCVGPLLMVWDFCNSFPKVLQLTPFSLYDLEKALLHTEESTLLSETYFAIFRLLLSEQGAKQRLAQRRKRKVLLSIETWKEDLCDYLELEGPKKIKAHLPTIRTGCYASLPVISKLEILEELIERALNTTAIRNQIDSNIEEHESLSAQRRAEGLPISMRKGSRSKTATLERGSSDELSEYKAKECSHEDGCLIGWLKKGRRSGINGVKREYSARCLFFNSSRQTLFRCNRVEVNGAQTEKEKAELQLQKRLEQLDREIEKCIIRMSPLGKDRNYNRYWYFHKEGRIFVESEDSNTWSFYSSKKELDELYESLNQKGAREKALRGQIEAAYSKISSAMQKRAKEVAQRVAIEEANLRRSQRVQSAPRPTGFLAYVNKQRNV